MLKRYRSLWALLILAGAGVLPAHPARAQDCEQGEFDSTFELIQAAIFEKKGCTESICHGGPPSETNGGLDLRHDVAYDNLVDVDAQTVEGYSRVRAGRKDASLLWINVVAKTFPEQYTAPLRPMPLDPVPPLSADEVEAIRLWIERGAPRTGVVAGTDELLDACLPPPGPIEVKPLPPPEPGKGVQLRMPRWEMLPNSERETCSASYYDITDQVPEEFRGSNGTTFVFNRNEVRQSA
jgi:hypothetical protein